MSNKKALCVGINDYPGTGNDLGGCVNDANDWANLLKGHFGFTDVKMLLDSQATKQNILDGLNDLIDGAETGDVLVFTNSSHGTYEADVSGDEFYDEAVCAVDVNILDDELRQIFNQIPNGVNLTVILDNCHSGTATRANPLDKKRFMSPTKRGGREIDLSIASPKDPSIAEEDMKEILLSGCNADEVSWDVTIGSTRHGAMSYCAIQAIKEANYQITYQALHRRLNEILIQEGYQQTPQLEGKAANKERNIFS